MYFPIPSFLAVAIIFAKYATGASFTNPLKSPNGSDPFMVYAEGFYYLTTTTWTDIQIVKAKTLAELKTARPVVVWTDNMPSRVGNIWAPELHLIDSKWHLYYTAGTSTCCDNQRLHVLVGGTNPLDKYTYSGQLDTVWGIDASILRFPNQLYLIWSRFSDRSLQSIYIAKLTPPATIGTLHLLSEPTNAWERVQSPVNEGPAAMYHGGKTYIAFSASYCWAASYQLGLLTYKGSGDPLQSSNWVKSGPVFSSANGNFGTGHNGFFTSPDGSEIWNIFHATKATEGACDGGRYTMAQRVDWTADGTPNFGKAGALGKTLTSPSGE